MRELTGSGGTVISLVSGKGGVGKSIVAVNLAETLSMTGYSVCLLDADVGQSACGLLLGDITEVELVLPSASGESRPDELISALDHALESATRSHDYVIVDASSGLGLSVRWALDRSDAALVIVVDEPTAVADAYGLCKLIWSHDEDYPIGAVVNMVDSREEASEVLGRFSALTEHFLNRKILYAGWVPFSRDIRKSVRSHRPAVRLTGPVRDAFEELANRLRCGIFRTTHPIVLN